jgi:5-methylcytosine-specific restriction endonuclease McrA
MPPCNYSQYHPEWKTKIRPDILERDGNCCKFCGVENHKVIHRYGKGMDDWEYFPEGLEGEAWLLDNIKPTKIILTIAHLDHDKTNNNYDNLAALCQKCHLGIDMSHHVANRKASLKKKKGLQELF